MSRAFQRIGIIACLMVAAPYSEVHCIASASLPSIDPSALLHHYYYYNEVTGAVQLEDPGDVPFEDESGFRHKLSDDGKHLTGDSSMFQYLWVEQHSAEIDKPYYFNQATGVSVWERPADLAWRRILISEE